MDLRPYQQDIIDRLRASYGAGHRAPLLCSPTGSGKSAMVGYILGRTRKQTLYLCHRSELMAMVCQHLDAVSIPYGVVAADRHDAGPEQIHVGMVQTVLRRLDRLPAYEWVISDEAHLAMAPGWRRVLGHYGAAHHLGMSATPCRLDGKGLGDVYDDIIYGPSIGELTGMGFLAPLRVFHPPAELGGIKTRMGEYDMGSAAQAIDTSTITGDAVREYTKYSAGKRALVFCCTIAHAEGVARQFTDAGIPAAHVDGAMAPDERAKRVEAFRAGTLPVLTNVDLLTTGFDCPAIECLIFLRPTQSLALYLQMIGRATRIWPGKGGAVIQDHVGNTVRHGMPDEAREWTLDGRPKSEAKIAVRQCEMCFAVFRPAPVCPECGAPCGGAGKPRKEKQRLDAELVEANATLTPMEQWLRSGPLKAVLKGRKTFAAIEEVRVARGYKPGFTWMRLAMMERHRHG